jgi:hypothetical protein
MQNPFQPGFQNIIGAAPGTDFDNMSEEELTRLINQAHRVKTGRDGRVAPAAPPKPTRIVDLDRILESNNV